MTLHACLGFLLINILTYKSQASYPTCIPFNDVNMYTYNLNAGSCKMISYARVTCEGKVSGWEFIMQQTIPVPLHVTIWRPDATDELKLHLIGVNELTDLQVGYQVAEIPLAEQIPCMPGDYYGVFAEDGIERKLKSLNEGGIGSYRSCAPFNVTGETTQIHLASWPESNFTDAIVPIIQPLRMSEHRRYETLGHKTSTDHVIRSYGSKRMTELECAKSCNSSPTSCLAFSVTPTECHLHSAIVAEADLVDHPTGDYYYLL